MLLLSLLSMDWVITGLIMVVVFYLTSVYLKDRKLRSFLPPGPVAWPLVGNLPQIIGQDLHIALTNLADTFGNLVWMKMGSENVLVVNSMDAAVSSLVRQGKVFSGRPKKRKTVEVLLGEGRDIVMNDVLPELKLHRRIVHSFLSSQTHSDKDRLKHIILNESRSLEDKMKTLHSESSSFDPKFQVARVVANVLCQCILSRRFDDVDEQFHEQLRIVQDIVDNIESFNIVDVIPWLEHFPIPSWRRFLTSLEKKDKWINQVIHEHRETRTEEKDRDLVDIMLKIQKEALESGDEEEIRLLSDQNIGHIVHELFGGGIESTTMTILWFILYLIHNPQWQERIYEEIHENTESGELPSPFERANYPLLEATVKETLRMACILPVGFPHRTLRDTELNGYYIPADTMVLMNIWAIHHDKNAWKDPDTFNPERFLHNDSGERYSYLPFGIGHRVCLGSNIAKMSVFSFCATLIKNYKITVPDGCPLPDMKPNAGLTNRPKPFEIKLVERC